MGRQSGKGPEATEDAQNLKRERQKRLDRRGSRRVGGGEMAATRRLLFQRWARQASGAQTVKRLWKGEAAPPSFPAEGGAVLFQDEGRERRATH